jgi:hypothetical protein
MSHKIGICIPYRNRKEHIDKLIQKKGDEVTTVEIVEDAKKPSSPTHDYFEWNEKVVDDRLSQIEWLRPANRSSWRIGDGTSAFYNIAYLLHQGWCENDVLRSNQIRCGHYKLPQIQDLLKIDNAVNIEMLEWYFSILELNPDKYLNMLISRYQN